LAIAYVSQDEPPRQEGDERHDFSFVADVGYTHSRSTRPSHLWLVASGGGVAKRLTSGEWSIGPEDDLHWLPDGKRLVFAHYPGASDRLLRNPSIKELDLQSDEVTPWRQSFRRNQFLGFSSDGRHVLYRGQDGLWISLVTGGEDRRITNVQNLTMTAPRWTPDGKSVIFRGLRGPQSSLWVQPLDGPARSLRLGNPTRAFHMALNRNLAVVGAESNRPAELYFLKTLESSPERLTDFNAPIGALDLGKQEPLEWLTPDNFQMNGVLTFPPGYRPGSPYPLVVLIHGGPYDSSLLGFDVRSQWLTSHGWIVFEPNYRGSNNLPPASTSAPVGLRREGPAKDVISGVELLIARGIADRSKVAVSGWSYGAAVTTALIEQYPDRWRAAVIGAAPVDGMQQYALSSIGAGGDSPFTSPERAREVWDRSLISRAYQIKTPTLVLGNQGDPTVPITNAYYLYHALRGNGVETKLVVYPIEGHIAQDPVHQRDVNRRWADWIKQHMALP
jgi:dipeptidyl aminopeptidase/acylaminoacyl peptidase